jgi:hypothetical protein
MLERLRLIEGAPGRERREKLDKLDMAARPMFRPKPATPSLGSLGGMRELWRPWGYLRRPKKVAQPMARRLTGAAGAKNIPAIDAAD